MHRRIGPVSPIACDAETAALTLAKNQRIDARDTPFIEYFKAFDPKSMKRMTDLRPSQTRTAVQCSLQ